jgi:hypothetical protein
MNLTIHKICLEFDLGPPKKFPYMRPINNYDIIHFRVCMCDVNTRILSLRVLENEREKYVIF